MPAMSAAPLVGVLEGVGVFVGVFDPVDVLVGVLDCEVLGVSVLVCEGEGVLDLRMHTRGGEGGAVCA